MKWKLLFLLSTRKSDGKFFFREESLNPTKKSTNLEDGLSLPFISKFASSLKTLIKISSPNIFC